MGSYCELYIGKYSLARWKTYPDVQLIEKIFRPYDLVDEKGRRTKTSSRNGKFTFEISVDKLSQRMDALGYTIKRARYVFEKARKKMISEEKTELKRHVSFEDFDDQVFKDFIVAQNQSTIQFLEHLSFEKLQEEYKRIIRKRIAIYKLDGVTRNIQCLEDFLASREHEILDMDYIHTVWQLRIILSTQSKGKKVIYDLINVLREGYITRNFINWNAVDKVIVLTEGSTDAYFLKESLRLLYPHLAEVYYFMDFHETKNPGGAGHLVTIIKAFIGSGIRNKIVAIFDNDTGAKEAMQQLKNVKLPDNIVVMQYPNSKFTEKYPTYGPTGLTYLDINGLACSIELYLGKDVIMNKRKHPVQWKGYSVKTKTYQGEILNKEEIQGRFTQKLKSSKDGSKKGDWSGMDLILQQIFNAFQ